MRCPKCFHEDSKVIETRTAKESNSIRRRRQCLSCEHRFTTLEEMLREDIVVIKRDGTREIFDRQKLLAGITKATQKRPISAETIDALIAEIKAYIDNHFDSEVPSQAIGTFVMDRLKAIDQIAYVRFASIYKDFRDISDLEQEIKSLGISPF